MEGVSSGLPIRSMVHAAKTTLMGKILVDRGVDPSMGLSRSANSDPYYPFQAPETMAVAPPHSSLPSSLQRDTHTWVVHHLPHTVEEARPSSLGFVGGRASGSEVVVGPFEFGET